MAGSSVAAGTYRCRRCVYTLQINSTQILDRCRNCESATFTCLTGRGA